MDRGSWWATVHWVTKELDTTMQLTLKSFSGHWQRAWKRVWPSITSGWVEGFFRGCLDCLITIGCVLSPSVMSNSSRPHELYLTWLLCPCNFPGKNTGMECHFLLQGIFLTQGLNLCLSGLLHWQEDSLPQAPSSYSVVVGRKNACY